MESEQNILGQSSDHPFIIETQFGKMAEMISSSAMGICLIAIVLLIIWVINWYCHDASFDGSISKLVNNHLYLCFKNYRQTFTLRMLGLDSQNDTRNGHSILEICQFNNDFNKYMKSLNRSSKYYLKRSDKILKDNNIKMVEKSCNMDDNLITMSHCSVIFNHEMKKIYFDEIAIGKISLIRKLYLILKVIYESAIRIYKFAMMISNDDSNGELLEYYNEYNQLIAFCHLIAKGQTMRAMWFYQKRDYSHCYIWYHCLKQSVITSININSKLKSNENESIIEYVDLGPSKDEKTAQNKSKFGFILSNDWQSKCNYNGHFVDICRC